MIARGIDPGDTIGWCDVERVSAGVFRFVECGTFAASDVQRGLGLPIGLAGIDVHAIETPEEMHHNDIRFGTLHGFKAVVQTIRNLLATRALAERIACSLVGAGARVIEPTAATCRQALGIRFGAQRRRGDTATVDQQIAALLPRIVRGWPKRSNVHVRDAAVCALYALGPADAARAIGGAST